jgi:hypothetical protein
MSLISAIHQHYAQRKDIYNTYCRTLNTMHREKTYTIHTVEHQASKAARLASWRKMTQPDKFGRSCARNYRPSFRKNKPKTLVFND